MFEWFALSGVAIAVYLLDCCTWTGARSWACYRRPLTGTWTAVRGSDLAGNEHGGVSLCDPLSLSGAIIQCSEAPYCAGAAGVVDCSAASAHRDHEVAAFTYDQLEQVHASLTDVYVGGDKVWRFQSPIAAQHAADHLRSLALLSPKKRVAAIRAEVERSMNVTAIEQTWRRFQADAVMLRRLCCIPLIWVYVVAPIVLVAIGPLASWPYLLGGLFASAVLIAIAFVKLHRKLFPAEQYDRWVHAVSMVVFPIAAIRAADRLSKDLFSTFHPLAVVRVFCADSAAAINRPFLFDIGRDLSPTADGKDADIAGWYRHVVRAAAIAAAAVEPSPQPGPEAEDSSMTSYCPRCHRQFASGASRCSDCDGVSLMVFAS